MTWTHRALVWACIIVGMAASYRLGHDHGGREERYKQEIENARWWSGCLASRAKAQQILDAREAARPKPTPPPTVRRKLGRRWVVLVGGPNER